MIVTVQALDADLVTGPRCGKSDAIVLLPEPISQGSTCAASFWRYSAFSCSLLDYRMAAAGAAGAGKADARSAKSTSEALGALERALRPIPPKRSSRRRPIYPAWVGLRFFRQLRSAACCRGLLLQAGRAALLGADVLMAELSKARRGARSARPRGRRGRGCGAGHAGLSPEHAPSQRRLLRLS